MTSQELRATDLRCGNLLFKEGIVVVVDGVTIANMEMSEDHQSRYDPIPLSEEWLLKLGFNKGQNESDRNVYYCGIFAFVLNNQCGYIDSIGRLCVLPHKPEYVHQLQNLYFALCGDELILK